MRRLKHREIRNTALRAIEELKWIADNAHVIADHANNDVDDGLAAARYDTDGRGGAELTQPERRGEQRAHHPDAVHERMTRFLGTLKLTKDTALAARDIAGELIVSKDPRDQAAQRNIGAAVGAAGSGHCENCTRWCPGEANDRLKAGRCGNCYDYRWRYGVERPRDLWESASP